MFSTYVPTLTHSFPLSWELPRAARVSLSWCPHSTECRAVSAWVNWVRICCSDVIMYCTPFCSPKCLEWNDHPAWHVPVRPHLCLALLQSLNPQLIPKVLAHCHSGAPVASHTPLVRAGAGWGLCMVGDVFHAKIRISSQCDRQKLCVSKSVRMWVPCSRHPWARQQ